MQHRLGTRFVVTEPAQAAGPPLPAGRGTPRRARRSPPGAALQTTPALPAAGRATAVQPHPSAQ